MSLTTILPLETGKRPVKGMARELYRLRAFRRNNVMLCDTALADATEDRFEDWIVERLEQVKPNTVGRDIPLMKPLFVAAAREYGLAPSPRNMSRRRVRLTSAAAAFNLKKKHCCFTSWSRRRIRLRRWRFSPLWKRAVEAAKCCGSNGPACA